MAEHQKLRWRRYLFSILLIVLLFSLWGASYLGVGIAQVRASSVRDSSVNGIGITSGGPGDGK